MSTTDRLRGINLRRNPYRGILTEIANEQGITKQAAQSKLSRLNIEMIEAVMKKVEEREAVVRRFENATEQQKAAA